MVWILDSQNRVSSVVVEASAAKDGRVEIISGLKGGERVVVNPTKATLSKGQLVKLSE